MSESIKAKRSNWFLSICFIVLISLPFFGSIFDWDLYERQSENRLMATFPEIKSTPIIELPGKLEKFCNDNFGFRNTFIRRHRKIEEKWFGRNSTKAFKGNREGWWFYGAGDNIDDYLGLRNFSAEELQRWEIGMAKRTAYLSARGIHYIFMILPDKTMVYPEYLQETVRGNRGQTRFEQLREHLSKSSDFKFSYPIQELIAAKENAEVYFPGDTHWNDYGGYLGYCYLVEQLRPIRSSITPVSDKDCSVETSSRNADIAGTLRGKNKPIVLERLIPPHHENMIIETSVELAGPNWESKLRSIPFHCHNPKGSGTAVIIHDSFYAQGMSNLIPTHFKDTYFFYAYANTFEVIDLADRFNPDVIIELRVERSLQRIPKNTPGEENK
jgi:alginate O-acetyltransferase complex protein AlgJ